MPDNYLSLEAECMMQSSIIKVTQKIQVIYGCAALAKAPLKPKITYYGVHPMQPSEKAKTLKMM